MMEVDISSKGHYIAASSTVKNPTTRGRDINVYLFNNLNSTPKVPLWTDTITSDQMADISITPLGDFILVGGGDSVYLYRITISEPLLQKEHFSQGIQSVAISADGKYFVVGGLATLWFFNRINPALIEELLWLAIFSYAMLATSSIGIIKTYSIMKKRIPLK